jgi:hypothetical protein
MGDGGKMKGTARLRFGPQNAAYWLMTAALCWTAFLSLRSSYTNALLQGLPQETLNPMHGIDALIRGATSEGNAVVVFKGFLPARDADAIFISRIFSRGNYIAYPRRVFVCGDNERFDPDAIARTPFAPDDFWLRAHHVHSLLTFSTSAPGNLDCAVRKL